MKRRALLLLSAAFYFLFSFSNQVLAQECDSNEVIVVVATGDEEDVIWQVWMQDSLVATGGPYGSGDAFTDVICLDNGCYTLDVLSETGLSESLVSLIYDDQVVALISGNENMVTFGINDSNCGEEIAFGCLDPNACNYDPFAQLPDDSCTYPGCLDEEAINYNPEAGCADDSCEYAEDCDGITAVIGLFDSFGDGWNGAYYIIYDANGYAITGTLDQGMSAYQELCLYEGCYSIEVGGGSFDSEISWTIEVDGEQIAEGVAPQVVEFGINTDGCGPVYGCLDPNACNYNEDATQWDNSCTYPGCTDEEAPNYNEYAGCDDGSCFEPGCGTLAWLYVYSYCEEADAQLTNFDGEVIWDGYYSWNSENGDTSSTYNQLCLPDDCYTLELTCANGEEEYPGFIYVYFDDDGDGYTEYYGSEQLPIIDGTVSLSFGIGEDCGLTEGCLDPEACNYNSEAYYPSWDCVYPGCTDPEALNYNPNAGCDDESCLYPEPCDNAEVQIVMFDSFGDGWNGANYVITNSSGEQIAGTLDTGSYGITYLCLEDDCYDIYVGGGTFDSEITWQILVDDVSIASGDAPIETQFGINTENCGPVLGCTWEGACNYNPDATINDGSCTFPGCTDEEAPNFDPYAGCDDGSCYQPDCGTIVDLSVYSYCTESFAQLTNFDGDLFWEAEFDWNNTGEDSTSTYHQLCLPDGCYTLELNCLSDDQNYPGYMYVHYDYDQDGYNEWFSTEQSTGSDGNLTLSFALGEDCGLTYGCMDPWACNYDSEADYADWASCVYPGCMDPEADNYNPYAGCDDGSCEYSEPCFGVEAQLYVCTFANGWEVELDIENQDGEVLIEVEGLGSNTIEYYDLCLDPEDCYTISMYNNTSTGWYGGYYWIMIDGVQVSTGELAPDADFGQVFFGDGCGVLGCTDEEALNYNEEATLDNGSCEYPIECDENYLVIHLEDTFGDGWDSASYIIVGESGSTYAGTLEVGNYELQELCLPDDCYAITVGGGTFDSEISWSIVMDGDTLASGGAPVTTGFSINSECEDIYGCTNELACNYDDTAAFDDGTCCFPGCMDQNAINFDPWACCEADCEYGPENDLCADATPLEPGTYEISNVGAWLNEGKDGDCWGFGAGEDEQTSIWFSFTTPDYPAAIVLETYGDGTGTLTDTQFGLYEDCEDEEAIECDGNSGDGLFAMFVFECGDLAENTTYILQIDGWASDTGTCMLDYMVTDCDDITFGCTVEWACNYDPEADYDDSSCTYPGCTDEEAWNYVEWAGCDDGSCQFLDCEEPVLLYFSTWLDGISALPWNILDSDGGVVATGEINFNQGNVIIPACLADGCYSIIIETGIDLTGLLDILLWIDADGDGYYETFVETAAVEDESITIDFGINSDCEEEEEMCEANEVVLNMFDSFGDGWNGATYSLLALDGNDILDGTLETGEYASEVLCLENGCYILYVGGGTFDSEISWELILGDVLLASGTAPFEGVVGVDQDNCEGLNGCTNPEACNFNDVAIFDDGTCTYPGCMDEEALNYDPNASCEGECVYPEPCDFNELTIWISTQSFGGEVNWELSNDNDEVVASGGGYESNSNYYQTLCLEDGCFVLTLLDDFGDGWNGGFYMIFGEDGLVSEGTLPYGSFQLEIVSINSECDPAGCTDPDAFNYSPTAIIDDGSCLYGGDGFGIDQGLMIAQTLDVDITPNIVSVKTIVQVSNIDEYKDFEWFVTDITGKLIRAVDDHAENSVLQREIDVTTLESGMYFITLRQGHNVVSSQFVVSH